MHEKTISEVLEKLFQLQEELESVSLDTEEDIDPTNDSLSNMDHFLESAIEKLETLA